MIKNNRLVIDLSKCSYAVFYYRNQYGDKVNIKPKFSVRGVEYNFDDMMFGSAETMKAYADRNHLTDVWIPEVKFQLVANHSVTYTGPKAVSTWKEWNRRIFNSK